ncbi:class I SAM-dependent methyltransferase [Aquibium microcysteis]|uniref:class I SAM-dependent methyltransferase n=1 Tax=Aquibium microcysteis TaxID=675281 RepID=UPI00165D096F|nr:class I SAM-dependent methyltransferase [Aquibium microcysteis]
MTRLGEKIAALVAQAGPIGIAEYMALCLFDPEHGYYTTREPFGSGGDFTTAPEVSQMFGELVAVWVYMAWQGAGSPPEVCVAELGPGRGTLMKDMVRTLAQFDRAFVDRTRFALVEASPRLVEVQRATLAPAPARFEWHDRIDGLPDLPTLFVGNEIFDAIPARQYVKHGARWPERCVGLDDHGRLRFVLGSGVAHASLLPPGADRVLDGTVLEHAPAREAFMQAVAERLARFGGAALFFDYGHLEPGFGDTLQAVRLHAPDGVLDHPGEADLTSHVDFRSLAAVAERCGLAVQTAPQRDVLFALGLAERVEALSAGKSGAERERITGEAERLAGSGAMGDLFKALLVTRPA